MLHSLLAASECSRQMEKNRVVSSGSSHGGTRFAATRRFIIDQNKKQSTMLPMNQSKCWRRETEWLAEGKKETKKWRRI